MASGSQTKSGSWADLPVTPSSMKRVISSITPGLAAATTAACAEDLVKLQGAKIGEDEEHGDEQSKIADAVGDEGFLGGDGIADTILALFKPETDEQVGAQAHAFPADEHHQEVIGADQDHHGGDEEVEEDKEAGKAPGVAVMAHIIVHVADGVNVDERAHAGNHQHHHHRKGIHTECPAGGEIADGDPIREDNCGAFGMTSEGNSQQDGDHECQSGGQAGQRSGKDLAQSPADEQVDAKPDERKENHPGNQVEELSRFHNPPG